MTFSHTLLEEARRALRFSVADSPLLDELESLTPNIQSATAEHVGETEDLSGYKLLCKSAIPVLQEMDASGLFGVGPARIKLLLAIIVEDVDEDSTLGSIPKLNPPEVVEEFRRLTEVKGIYQSVTDLCITGGGRSVYTVRSRKNAGGKSADGNEFLNEMVAYSLRLNTLVRRWDRIYPGFGDSLRAVAVDPVDGSVIILRQRYLDKKATATLTRFSPDSPAVSSTVDFAGESNGRTMTVSKDGVVAIAGHQNSFWIFDRGFNILHSHRVAEKITAMASLPACTLLVGTRKSLTEIDPATGLASRSILVDAMSNVTYSRWFDRRGHRPAVEINRRDGFQNLPAGGDAGHAGEPFGFLDHPTDNRYRLDVRRWRHLTRRQPDRVPSESGRRCTQTTDRFRCRLRNGNRPSKSTAGG